MGLRTIAGVLVSCALVACSGDSGPRDDEVVMGVRALGAARGLLFAGVKKLDCRKMKENEVKDSGVFYRCEVELTMNGKTSKEAAFFQKTGEQYMAREFDTF